MSFGGYTAQKDINANPGKEMLGISLGSKRMKQDYAGWQEIKRLAVRQAGRWAVYISHGLDLETEEGRAVWAFVLAEAAKLFPQTDDLPGNLWAGGSFFFDTEAEMDAFYAIFAAPLTDSSAIYACTYNPSGEDLTENT